MSLTTDPSDPELTRGVDKDPVEQAKKYLVLSEEERAKGYIRPVRVAYIHVGRKPQYPLRDLTEEEKVQYASYKYVKLEEYPPERSPLTGRFWTQAMLDAQNGCGVVTTMGQAIAETYARDPSFYGSTYCTGCRKHLAVEEFVWDGTDERVGS